MSIAMMAMISIFVVLAFVPSIQDKAAQFLMKSGNDDAGPITAEAVTSSRMGLVDKSLRNFKKSPLLGNGFQVSVEMKKLKQRGLAILSAPIEKGVWVVAVLEEGGVIGMAIFVVFLLSCIVKSIKRRAYIGASCLFVFTVSNLGEFSFFSMSYVGGFGWAMIFVGLALDLRKMEDENEALRRQFEFEQMQLEMMERPSDN